jgi:hypothetical protein
MTTRGDRVCSHFIDERHQYSVRNEAWYILRRRDLCRETVGSSAIVNTSVFGTLPFPQALAKFVALSSVDWDVCRAAINSTSFCKTVGTFS